MNRTIDAMLAGLIATIPQTLAMEATRRVMPAHPGRFPPRQVTEDVVARLHVHQRVPRFSEETWKLITTVCHFGYGTAAGALLPLTPGRQNRWLRGALFGLGVWIGSYGILLPLLGVHRPQADHPIRKNLQLMIAHVGYGIAASLCFEGLRRTSSRPTYSRLQTLGNRTSRA